MSAVNPTAASFPLFPHKAGKSQGNIPPLIIKWLIFFCPATGRKKDRRRLRSCSRLSDTGHAHRLGRPPPAHLSGRGRRTQPRVCLGRKWIFEEAGINVEPPMCTCACVVPAGVSPVCSRFMEFAYPAHPLVSAVRALARTPAPGP